MGRFCFYNGWASLDIPLPWMDLDKELTLTGWRTLTVAYLAFQKHRALHPLNHYTGMLSLQAYARLALASDSAAMMATCRELLLPFVRGEQRVGGNFVTYECGGNATALLLWQGHLSEARDAVHHAAEALIRSAPRDAQGIFSMPGRPTNDLVWIDVAFAVTPFLLHAGLALEEGAYLDEAAAQVFMLYDLLRDPAQGLLHQCKHFAGPGKLSEDHWSRGNGWALLALAELVRDLPEGDPLREPAERRFRDLVRACLAVQDGDGLWHQELTVPASYVETSGTGLILYAIGVGVARGLLDDGAMDAYRRGLAGYLAYIRDDGAVYHTCRGCLCPGEGTVLDYMARAPLLNDPHAFGPVTLAFGQAHRLGLASLTRPT